MNTKIYEKTRYQNIYRHKKNKNYLIMISKPVKTSISSINGKKILKLEEALKIRDNPKIKLQKGVETTDKETFDTLWYKYIVWCETNEKQAKNTIKRKQGIYNVYLKNKFNKKVSKITDEEIIYYIDNLGCTDKNKNHIIKVLKAFFNWCVFQKNLIFNPILHLKKYKEDKPEMKFWNPEEIMKFINSIKKDIEYGINKEIAYRTYIYTLIGLSLGCRPGELRALKFNSFDEQKNIVDILYSIDDDPKNITHLKPTKTTQSVRTIDVSKNLINEIKKYKWYLINEFDYDILEDEFIFCNHITKKPLSDTMLRRIFYEYCDRAEVTKIRLNDLRHTYVAIMMGENEELYNISSRIGHSSYSTTVDKYGHLSNKKRKEIARITDKFFE